jgi:hypothetical protein
MGCCNAASQADATRGGEIPKIVRPSEDAEPKKKGVHFDEGVVDKN